ncbi:putative prenylated rab acceptor PRA1 [Rosa chinensis]|uniref:PRA1 family protein n=1 Tax=Rosa chinensis TaxID=74649 RepID=A0A2P6SEZ7_ROSCH|nr:PRA1 family protein F2 [Rosa chinensis]PRQ57230.1 putative prenylated rab acceptor PRA1 [Rosa chinensis]
MASHGTVQRPSTTTSTSPTLPTTHPHEPKDSTPRVRLEFSLCFPFNIPKTPEAAAARIIRNLSYYRLYYTLFIWIILFITLLPKRKLSLLFLIAMTALTCSFLAVMRLVPADSVVLQYKIIDRRLVLALLVIATMVELIVTRAAIHLFVTLACATPVILVHAVFRVRDDLCVEEKASAAGELVPLIKNTEPKLSDSV